MMAPAHRASGVVAGLGLGAAMDARPAVCFLLAGVSAVGSLVPDIDHRQSTVTRSVPILGRVASFVVRGASRTVYAATKGPRDEDHSGEHRHLSHTVAFALAFGALVGWGTFLAAERLGATNPGHLGWLVGVAMALGCVVHCVGDAATLSGCPFLWPIPIAGETFFELRPPRLLRFRTGGRLAVDLLTFCAPPVVAVVVYWASGAASGILVSVSLVELVAVGVIATQIAMYAELRRRTK